MSDMNLVVISGRLCDNPQLSYLPSQTPVVDFRFASNRKWKDGDGNPKESVCFISCRCFDKQAETINKFLRKGNPLIIQGRLDLEQWTTADNQKRSKHRIFIKEFTFMGQGEKKEPQPKPHPLDDTEAKHAPEAEGHDDTIPF